MTSDDRLPREESLDMSDEPNNVQPRPDDLQGVDQLAQLTLDYLDVLNGSQHALPQLDRLGGDLRARVLAAWSWVDRLIIDEPLPSLDGDPTAIALGAVPTTSLDPLAVRRTRRAQNLRPSDLAGSLQRKGWPTTTADVFAWERRPERVAPALLADVAAILSVSGDTLTHSRPDVTTAGGTESATAYEDTETFIQVLYSEDLNEVVQQWAHLLGLDGGAARRDLQRRLSNAAHRGPRTLTARQWKAVLLVLIASERARRGQPNDPPVDA